MDKSLEPHVAAMASDKTYDIEGLNFSDDLRYWVVALTSDKKSTKYSLYDCTNRRLTDLFTTQPELDAYPMAATQAAMVVARDGLEIPCYVTRAENEATDPSQRRAIVNIHGGPWARDKWSCTAFYQFLANRGYTVVNVNYRGSTGFGKNHVNAGNKQWAAKMHTDVLDVVEWVIANRIAPREQIGIWGGSYGGYETLVSLSMSPDVFCSGVDYVGPSNLVTLLESFPKYWSAFVQQLKDRVGDTSTLEGREILLQKSPITHAHKIKKPLLVIQGKNDPRVLEAESEMIVKALKDNKIPVAYLLFPDEGHGCNRSENWQCVLYALERFFSHTMGGRYQEIDSELRLSSVQVIEDDFGIFEELRSLSKTV